MERALFILLGLILNATLARSRQLVRLSQVPGHIIRVIERKLNRPQRTLKARRLRGIILLLAVLMVSLALGLLLAMLTGAAHYAEIAVLALLLPVRPTWEHSMAIYRALKADDTAGARLALKGTVWRHYALLDAHALARSAIEMLGVNSAEKIIAPICWYLAFGMPGPLLNKSLYLLQEHLCQPVSAESAFGRPSYILHYMANYIPARFNAVLWLLSMFFLQGFKPLQAFNHVATDIVTRPPEKLAVAATAAALNLSLGGPTSVYTHGQWLGSGSAKATPENVRQGLYLYILVQCMVVLAVALLV